MISPIQSGVASFLLLALQPIASSGLPLITTDPSVAAAFQAGATIETFDDLPALAITTYDDGQSVPPANQFSSRDLAAFTSPFFNSGGASFNDPVNNPGTPIGIFDPGGAIAGEVQSPNNVAGPLNTGTDEPFNNGFMEVIFPVDMIRVGVWITHGTNIQLILKDANNQNLATGDFSVTGSTGQFIGIQRETADVRGVTILFDDFTIDDFTYSTTAIPEPSSGLLAAMGLIGLLAWRQRHVAR
jgi:MYXO-CTERM domain-containing protein